MKILLLSRYGRLGASSRVRFLQYLPYLDAHGVTVTAAPLLDDAYLRHLYGSEKRPAGKVIRSYLSRFARLAAARSFDLIWLEKELFPFLPAWGERFLQLLGIPCVVDYDDAIFHGYDRHPGRLVRALLGNKIDMVMSRAALVIAGNDYLAERARTAGAKRVACLPSVVDLERYMPDHSRKNDIFTIGWIGSPSTAQYLKLAESSLAEVCRNGKARLVLVGSGPLDLPGLPLEIRPWKEDTEVAEICSFDVGIMPLADDPWERGKCGYKLIQCMACGLPVVASPVGVNSRIIDHEENGFLASTPDEWVHALKTLRDNHELRRSMGKAAREKVAKEYSLQVNAPRLLALLRSTAEESR